MTTPIWPHETGSTGLHVTSSKNDPDLTTNKLHNGQHRNYQTGYYVIISKLLEFWMDHNYVQNFEKLYFSKGETISPTLLIWIYFQKHFPLCQENMEVCIKFSFFSNNCSIRLDSLAAMYMSCQMSHKLKSRKWHWRLVPLPDLTSWHLAPSYHLVTVTGSKSLSTEQLF